MRLKAGGTLQRLQGRIFVTFPLQCVAKVLRLASRENMFYEHPEKMRWLHIKLQECEAIAIYFARARI